MKSKIDAKVKKVADDLHKMVERKEKEFANKVYTFAYYSKAEKKYLPNLMPMKGNSDEAVRIMFLASFQPATYKEYAGIEVHRVGSFNLLTGGIESLDEVKILDFDDYIPSYEMMLRGNKNGKV